MTETAATERAHMRTDGVDTEALQEELEHFRREKEKIRTLIGKIGGAAVTRRDRVLNTLFIAAIAALFAVDFVRHVLAIELPLPPIVSLELGVLLISLKIIWMIHRSTKVEHFQFWILNSIEFRLNELSTQVRRIERTLSEEG